jgi:hypothetical protein
MPSGSIDILARLCSNSPEITVVAVLIVGGIMGEKGQVSASNVSAQAGRGILGEAAQSGEPPHSAVLGAASPAIPDSQGGVGGIGNATHLMQDSATPLGGTPLSGSQSMQGKGAQPGATPFSGSQSMQGSAAPQGGSEIGGAIRGIQNPYAGQSIGGANTAPGAAAQSAPSGEKGQGMTAAQLQAALAQLEAEKRAEMAAAQQGNEQANAQAAQAAQQAQDEAQKSPVDRLADAGGDIAHDAAKGIDDLGKDLGL